MSKYVAEDCGVLCVNGRVAENLGVWFVSKCVAEDCGVLCVKSGVAEDLGV